MLAAERILLVASCSSSDDALSTVEDKYPSHQLFYREPNTVQIIQLDECAPPTPRKIASYYSSSYYSSECTSSCTSEEEEEEEDCSSYCSSDLPPDDPESSTDNDISVSGSEDAKLPTEMYSTFQRILAWRENFSSDVSSTGLESSDVTSRKRKSVSDDHDGDDSMSHTSKRSRSQPPASLIDAEAAMALDSHPCPACDASFATIEGLRHHGLDDSANEACCVAVEYAFES